MIMTNMRQELLNLTLPDKYREGLFEYCETLDGTPEWPELARCGYTWEKHLKLYKLVSIEHMKYMLKEYGDEFTEEEMKQAKELLEQTIQEYNEI